MKATRVFASSVFLFVALAPSSARSAPASLPTYSISERGLVGAIGDHHVRMELAYFGEHEPEGRYHVDKDVPTVRSWLADTWIRGDVAADGTFRMEETEGEPLVRPDAAAAHDLFLENLGVMTGTISFSGPVGRPTTRLTGRRTLADGGDPLPLSLAEREPPPGLRIVPRSIDRSTVRPRTSAAAIYPSIVGRPAFDRLVAGPTRKLVADLRTDANQGLDDVDPDEPSTYETDYEVTHATPALVSVLFREHYWYTVYVTHDQTSSGDMRTTCVAVAPSHFGISSARTTGRCSPRRSARPWPEPILTRASPERRTRSTTPISTSPTAA